MLRGYACYTRLYFKDYIEEEKEEEMSPEAKRMFN
jgi:hypothetical protein